MLYSDEIYLINLYGAGSNQLILLNRSTYYWVLSHVRLISSACMNKKLLFFLVVVDGFKFVLYVMFVAIMSKVHTFPLFAIRPLYLTMRWVVVF